MYSKTLIIFLNKLHYTVFSRTVQSPILKMKRNRRNSDSIFMFSHKKILQLIRIHLLYPIPLYLVPDNFICVQMNREAASIPTVDHGILGLISIIYHTILSVLHISMDIHIEIL